MPHVTCQSTALLKLTCCKAVAVLALAACTSKPDTVQGDEKAQKKFQEVSEAYDTLKDSSKRSMYDRVGPEGMENMGGFDGAQGFGGFGVRTSCSLPSEQHQICYHDKHDMCNCLRMP